MTSQPPRSDSERPRDTLDDPVLAPLRTSRYGVGVLSLCALGVLSASLVALGAAAAPSALRQLGVTGVRVVLRDYAKSNPAGRTGSDAVIGFEKSLDRMDVPELDDLEPGAGAQFGIGARDLTMRARPEKGAPDVGQVKKGEGLVVLRKEDGWVLVVHQPLGGGGDKGPLKVGWIPESDVLIP